MLYSRSLKSGPINDDIISRVLARWKLQRISQVHAPDPELSLAVPRELITSTDVMAARYRNQGNHTSVTAERMGDPPLWRSALGQFRQEGHWQPDGHMWRRHQGRRGI